MPRAARPQTTCGNGPRPQRQLRWRVAAQRARNPAHPRCWSLFSLALVAAPAIGLLGGCQRDDRQELSASEVKALFAGHSVQGHHDVHGYDFRSYYEPSGRFRSYQDGAKSPRSGRWSVLSDGRICVRWQDMARTLCRTMVTDGRGHYWKIYKVRGRRKAIVTFRRFVRGNPERL